MITVDTVTAFVKTEQTGTQNNAQLTVQSLVSLTTRPAEQKWYFYFHEGLINLLQ